MLEVQLMQQKGRIELGKVATLSQWYYLKAILFWTIKRCGDKSLGVNCVFREKGRQKNCTEEVSCCNAGSVSYVRKHIVTL